MEELAKKSGITDDEPAAASCGPASENRSGCDLRELAAAANIEIAEFQPGEGDPKQLHPSLQNRSIPMTILVPVVMIISFSLALGIMLWQRNTQRRAAPETATPQTAQPEAAGSPSVVSAHATGEPPLVPQLEPRKAALQPVATQQIQEESGSSQGVVPVAINIWNRRNRGLIEGYVTNTSDRPLSLTLEVVGQGHSVLQFNLPAGARREFSNESGFDMQSNDRVVVHSEPFQDVVTEVP